MRFDGRIPSLFNLSHCRMIKKKTDNGTHMTSPVLSEGQMIALTHTHGDDSSVDIWRKIYIYIYIYN